MDLDDGQPDASSCFNISEHLSWADVDLTSVGFEAPSVEWIREALQHVAFCAWRVGDI